MQKQSKVHSHSRVKSNQNKKGTFSLSLDQLYEKDVVCLKPDDTVYDAAREMLENHIGDIVITQEENGKTMPVGIVTDRDLVINATAKKLDPETIKLSDIMSKKVITATEDDDLTTLVRLVVDEGVSRLPIVDEAGNLAGILSSKRLFQYFAQGLCELSSISVQQQQREESTH